MKTLRMIAFAVATTTTACAAQAGFITGRVLYDHMTSGNTARQLAASYYVAGVFDSYHQSTHCAPDGVLFNCLMAPCCQSKDRTAGAIHEQTQ